MAEETERSREKNKSNRKKESRKGSVVISETLLEATGVIISFILIVLVIQLVFQQQTGVTFESAFESVARDISTGIDRAAAVAGSIFIEQPLPKGLKFNLTIDYKTVLVGYGGGKAVRKSTVGLTYTSPRTFTDPTILCIIKTANDRRVYVDEGECKCSLNDNVCDPVCSVKGICDPACRSSVPDDVCNPYCVRSGDKSCDSDCYRNVSDSVFDADCIDPKNNPDSICDPDSNNVKDDVCDKDCYYSYSNGKTGICDPDCPAKEDTFVDNNDNVTYKKGDGTCYTGCANATATKFGVKTLLKDGICDLDCKDSADICDPDCPQSEACKNKCTEAGNRADTYPCCEGLIAAPGDNICRDASKPLAACANGICEGRPGTQNGWGPGNKTRWETSYTCAADCPPAAQRPSCSPAGSFVSSVCYRDITNQDGTRTGDRPTWEGNAIAVCNAEVQKFLDRRNWDINQVFESVVLPPPEGYAFDASRYVNACDRIQNAGQTTDANENYSSEARICCSLAGTGCPLPEATYLGKQCVGVGYCADHAASMLSILRTLGIPDNLVFMTFDIQGQNCGRHAWVVMKCDPSLKSNARLWPTICNSNEGQWISVDATRHFVAPLSQTPCVSLSIFWNDKGIYPLTYGDAAVPDYANGTKRGLVYPSDAVCNTFGEPTINDCKNNFAVEHHYDDLCAPQKVECVLP